MSVAELLSAIRALPEAERVQLLHLLIDLVARPDLPGDDVIQGALFMSAIHGGAPGFSLAADLQQLLQDQTAKV